jgi:hypothetical protein
VRLDSLCQLFVDLVEFLFDPDDHLFDHPTASLDCRLGPADQLHLPDQPPLDVSPPFQADSCDQRAPEAGPFEAPGFARSHLLHCWKASAVHHQPDGFPPQGDLHRWREYRESLATGSVMDDSLNPPFLHRDLAARFRHQVNHHREPKDEFPRWANSDGSWKDRGDWGTPWVDWAKYWVDSLMGWVDSRMGWVDSRMGWAGSRMGWAGSRMGWAGSSKVNG